MLEYEVDVSNISSFLISLTMVTIGSAFFIGFGVKKVLQFLKSY